MYMYTYATGRLQGSSRVGRSRVGRPRTYGRYTGISPRGGSRVALQGRTFRGVTQAFRPRAGANSSRVGVFIEKGQVGKIWLVWFFFCMAVSRFDRFPIQMNFAENRNWTTSPNLAANPAHLVGGPTRGKGKTRRKQLKGGGRRVPT
jgi:murein tripeptide amidase MpaA